MTEYTRHCTIHLKKNWKHSKLEYTALTLFWGQIPNPPLEVFFETVGIQHEIFTIIPDFSLIYIQIIHENFKLIG